jgi:hypothetical protein
MIDLSAPKNPKDAAVWTKRIAEGDVKFGHVVRLATERALKIDDQSSDDLKERKLRGEMFYEQALDAFKKEQREKAEVIAGEVEVAIFTAGCGTYVSPDGRFWNTIIEHAIEFDWSCAGPLLARVQGLYDTATEIWPVPVTDSSADEPPEPEAGEQEADAAKPPAKRRRIKRLRARWRLRGVRRRAIERDPHARRAYQLCSSLFSAINLEKRYRAEMSERGKTLTREPSGAFEKRVWMVTPEIVAAEAKFQRAAQRHARGKYSQGMVLGAFAIGLISCGLAIAFQAHNIPAWYGVAALAGAVGAIVSVFQRMASGNLKLEYDAGDSTLITLGAVRPLVGAIFGTILFCAFEGGWLPAVAVETNHHLAFYAVLGFLAGFNERFAQDMLVTSAGQLTHWALGPEPDLRPPPDPTGAPEQE